MAEARSSAGMPSLSVLLLAVLPVAPALHFVLGAAPIWVFLSGAVAVAVLSDWIRRATEALAERIGPAVGSLLSVSIGSLAEIILALFVLVDGRPDVVRAQITGSIIGTALLGLGLAIVVGGVGRDKQTFRRERASLLSTMLILSVIALLLPAAFDLAVRMKSDGGAIGAAEERMSLGVSAVLLLLYGANLVYTLVTRRDAFAPAQEEAGPGRGGWSTGRALAILAAATVAVAVEADLVSAALEDASTALHLSPTFLGVVVLALVGTAADIFAAAAFARQDRMGLVLGITLGSAIQVALVVAPLLVILSWLTGHPMSLVFSNPLDLFAIAATVFAVNAIAADGETSWFEGVLLIGVYLLFAIAFFYVAPAP